ncbi:DegT/DnrJ/EryC1/StrS aminotransferase family protein [Kibdelosporangium persicum]|uniref:Glutamine--scyllo-inositol aminotransferase n=1 Tax=Kibdelosporangium persicum TaxID=2698649 RepID=A0ABX2FDE4_9PSEU|nr:DegT/DnrJ/EryC1/StrS family aminotransferase [Kibdelosporangium persicum]NRN69396.1 Glutamine--scyllo-inositol aminotransferase [Kibdelosporangium persicum]
MTDETLALFGGQPIRTQPWPRWPQPTQDTYDAVADVLGSTRWAVSGPYDGRVCYERQFAHAFAAFHEVPYCTPTTSGTASLTIALQALGVGRGDEVLVPGLTWVACASAVVHLGAVPVLVDCDPHTLAMSVDRAREALTPRTAAIMVVHPYCSVADLDAFVALAEQAGVPLVEDCAQAHGARWRNRPVGTFGAAGCFSMQQAKLLTSGEGGAVVTADESVHQRLEQLRSDGRLFMAGPQVGQLELREVGGVLGRNLCLSELQAAVLLTGLRRLAADNERRHERACQLTEALRDCEGVSALPADPRVTTRTYYNFVLRLRPEAFAGNTVDAVARALSAELGTSVNPVYPPLNRHRLYRPDRLPRGEMSEKDIKRLDPAQYELAVCEEARRTCMTFTHPVLLAGKDGVDDIVAAIRKVHGQSAGLLRAPQEPSTQAI